MTVHCQISFRGHLYLETYESNVSFCLYFDKDWRWNMSIVQDCPVVLINIYSMDHAKKYYKSTESTHIHNNKYEF